MSIDTVTTLALGALSIIGGLSPVLAIVKRITGAPKPTDGTAKKVWFGFLQGLDYLAINSTPIKAQLTAMQLRSHVASQQTALVGQTDALIKQQSVIAEKEKTIRVQSEALRASMRHSDR